MAGNHVLLETIELTSSASSVTFDNIPQSGYTDLKLIISTRHSGAQDANAFYIKFNGSTTSQSAKFIEGSGTSAVSGSNANPYGGVENGSASLANTYNNCEIYIPNYTSSNQKSYSSDSVSENNTTAAYQWLTAGLWANTSAITSIAIMPDNGTKSYVAGSTFSLYGIAATGTTPVTAPKATGGNMVSTDGTYWYHTFLSSGTFTPQTDLTCDYLLVAGGGGAWGNRGGGGGAGGLLTGSYSATNTNYAVAIGAAGVGETAAGGSRTRSASSGSNTTLFSLTAIGGGRGAANDGGINVGANGGSGGGGTVEGGTPGSGTAGQGYGGGTHTGVSTASSGAAGGGGGYSAVGGNGSGDVNGGNGGAGWTITSTFSPSGALNGMTVLSSGGGGGAPNGTAGTGGTGAGNGGYGKASASTGNGGHATSYGSGGGGGSYLYGYGDGYGGDGKQGIVIIRYPMA